MPRECCCSCVGDRCEAEQEEAAQQAEDSQ